METQKSPLPNFQCAAYRVQAPVWRYLDAIYQGRDAWCDRKADGSIKSNKQSKEFLPKAPKELPSNYEARLKGTPYVDKFAQAIRDFVGLIFSNGLNWQGVPDQILECLGDGVQNTLMNRAIAAMRRGHALMLVDAPRGGGRSLLDAQRNLPRWVPIDNYQVLNWRYRVAGTRKLVTQCTIKETSMVPDGAFGEKEETFYLVLSPGRYDRFQLKEDRGRTVLVYRGDRSGRMGATRRGVFVPLDFVPLVVLAGGQDEDDIADPLVSRPPLQALADLNLAHYQLYSDHLNKIRKTCRPVYVRLGTMGEQEELVISSDTTVDVPPGGGFLIAEPNANSITQSRQELDAISTAMDFLAAGFLVKPSDRQAAMVSLIQVAKVESGLTLFVNAFVEGVNTALQMTGAYLGYPPDRCGRLRLESEFFEQMSIGDAQMLLGYSQFFQQLQTMPRDNALALLRIVEERGYLGKRFSAESVLNQIQTMEALTDGKQPTAATVSRTAPQTISTES